MSVCQTCALLAEHLADPTWVCINMADELSNHNCESTRNPSLECQCVGSHNRLTYVCRDCILAAMNDPGQEEYGPTEYPAEKCIVDGDLLLSHDCRSDYSNVECWCCCRSQHGLLVSKGHGPLEICRSCTDAAVYHPPSVFDLDMACIVDGNVLPNHNCEAAENTSMMCWCRCSRNRSVVLCRYCIFAATHITEYYYREGGPDEVCTEYELILPDHRCEAADDLAVMCRCGCSKHPSLVCEDCLFYAGEELIAVGEEHILDPQWVCINQADSLADHECSAAYGNDTDVVCLCSYGHGREHLCDPCFSGAMDTAKAKRIDPLQVCTEEGDRIDAHKCEAEDSPWEICKCLCRGHDPIQLCKECVSAAKPTATSYKIDPKRVCTEPGWGIPKHTCESTHYDFACHCSCQRSR